MSEYTFYLVPEDSDFVATPEQVQACKDLWRFLTPGLMFDSVYNHPQLMLWNPLDVKAVNCSACRSNIPVTFDYETFKAPEHGAWWRELVLLMQSDEGNGTSVMPCCGASLNNKTVFLGCTPQAVYSRFACGAHEPDVALFEPDHGPLKAEHVSQFEKLLGQKLLHLWLGD